MNCWFCGHDLIWQNDFSFDDYCYDGDGIVAVLWCQNCGTMVEAVHRFGYNPETGDYEDEAEEEHE